MMIRLNILKAEDHCEEGPHTYLELEGYLNAGYIELRITLGDPGSVQVRADELLGAVKALCQIIE